MEPHMTLQDDYTDTILGMRDNNNNHNLEHSNNFTPLSLPSMFGNQLKSGIDKSVTTKAATHSQAALESASHHTISSITISKK